MKRTTAILSLMLAFLIAVTLINRKPEDTSMTQFKKGKDLEWIEIFADSCTQGWKEKWTLDGLKATVTNDASGMSFAAGPIPFEQASHAVLWTISP